MTIRLLAGDCRDVLATLPDASVHCVVTSPPYYGLRDYGTAQWDGGDAQCDHSTARSRGDDIRPGDKQGTSVGSRPNTQRQCLCGATRVDRQIGLEATPDEYLATMVQVFRQIRRVLRPDGTCWVNIGDGYVHGPPHAGSVFTNGRNDGRKSNSSDEARGREGSISLLGKGLAAKQLLLMPARLALALQADGWWVRSEIIWHKPNPMPESCTDRPTSAHEHVFLLTRSSRYFYDADAVREDADATRAGVAMQLSSRRSDAIGRSPTGNEADPSFGVRPAARNLRNVWTIATHALSSAFSDGSYRIASRDCAVHDRQADLAHVLECDVRQGVSVFGRNPGKRSRPAELPEGAVVSIPVDRSSFPSGVFSAIGHNSPNHRTPVLSERDVIFGDIPGGHIECRALLDHSFAMFARKPASNTVPDASFDEPLSCQSVENPDRIVGIATYEPRPNGCNCYYAGTVNKRQDHFASFPPELASRCIRAGTSARGCCAQCGAPWRRVVEQDKYEPPIGPRFVDASRGDKTRKLNGAAYNEVAATRSTTGWSPSCRCCIVCDGLHTDAPSPRVDHSVAGSPPGESGPGSVAHHAVTPYPTVPATVLDPFAGAGTTLMVADRLQRDCIGIDLNPDYNAMSRARITDDAPLFAEFPVTDPADERMADDARQRDMFGEDVPIPPKPEPVNPFLTFRTRRSYSNGQPEAAD